MFFGLKRGFSDHNVAPLPQIRPKIAKTVQNHRKKLAALIGGLGSCYIDKQLLWFHWMILSKMFKVRKIGFLEQSGFPATKAAWINKKTKITPKRFKLWSDGGPDSCYISNQPLYFHWKISSKILGLKMGFQTTKRVHSHKSGLHCSKNAQHTSFGSNKGCILVNLQNEPFLKFWQLWILDESEEPISVARFWSNIARCFAIFPTTIAKISFSFKIFACSQSYGILNCFKVPTDTSFFAHFWLHEMSALSILASKLCARPPTGHDAWT